MFNVEIWPELHWEQWKDTAKTLHMFMQIVGKTRLALTSKQNHWWNVTFYVTARGLSTSAMSLPTAGCLTLSSTLLRTNSSSAAVQGRRNDCRFALKPSRPSTLSTLQYSLTWASIYILDPMPVELKEPVRFDETRLIRATMPMPSCVLAGAQPRR